MDNTVRALTVFDDGSGPALYAGGDLTSAGGVRVNRIAKWDGASWSALGSGVNGIVKALAVHDDGGGPALYAGGGFSSAGGVAASFTAKWDGADWSALGRGMNSDVLSLTVFDEGGGPALFAGGDFSSALDSHDSYLAKWGCDTTPPTISCPPPVSIVERLGSSPGEVVDFSVTAEDDVGQPTVVCTPPSGSLFPVGTTLVTCTATDASGNQSTCEFPVTVALKARRR